MPRKPNPVWILASWFITEFLKREIGPGDRGGQHFGNARNLLKEFALEDIEGCLLAAREGWLGPDVPVERITSLPAVKWLEPPLIARWLTLKETPPPVWMTETYRQWLALTSRAEVADAISE